MTIHNRDGRRHLKRWLLGALLFVAILTIMLSVLPIMAETEADTWTNESAHIRYKLGANGTWSYSTGTLNSVITKTNSDGTTIYTGNAADNVIQVKGTVSANYIPVALGQKFTLSGYGEGSTIQRTSGSTALFIIQTKSADIVIEDITIDGGSSSLWNTSYGVFRVVGNSTTPQKLTLRNSTVQNVQNTRADSRGAVINAEAYASVVLDTVTIKNCKSMTSPAINITSDYAQVDLMGQCVFEDNYKGDARADIVLKRAIKLIVHQSFEGTLYCTEYNNNGLCADGAQFAKANDGEISEGAVFVNCKAQNFENNILARSFNLNGTALTWSSMNGLPYHIKATVPANMEVTTETAVLSLGAEPLVKLKAQGNDYVVSGAKGTVDSLALSKAETVMIDVFVNTLSDSLNIYANGKLIVCVADGVGVESIEAISVDGTILSADTITIENIIESEVWRMSNDLSNTIFRTDFTDISNDTDKFGHFVKADGVATLSLGGGVLDGKKFGFELTIPQQLTQGDIISGYISADNNGGVTANGYLLYSKQSNGEYTAVGGADTLSVIVEADRSVYGIYCGNAPTYYLDGNEYKPAKGFTVSEFTDTVELCENAVVGILRINDSFVQKFGYQIMTEAEDSFDIRFILGVDDIYVENYGFKITAKYGETSQSFDNQVLGTVYSSITGGEKTYHSFDKTEFAQGNYLIPVAVEGITSLNVANADEIVFVIEAYKNVTQGDNTTYSKENLLNVLEYKFTYNNGVLEAVPATVPEGTEIKIDFNVPADSTVKVTDYISAVDGVGPVIYGGGQLVDGMWSSIGSNNVGVLMFVDEYGIIKTGSYEIEFDFIFDAFPSVESYSAMALFVADDIGISQNKRQYDLLKATASGSVNPSDGSASFTATAGTMYHYKAVVNAEKIRATISGEEGTLSETVYTFAAEDKEYGAFRFLGGTDAQKTTEFRLDNLTIKRVKYIDPQEADLEGNRLYASDGAYVRGGIYADTHQNLSLGNLLLIKNDSGESYDREALLKFNISLIDNVSNLEHAYFYPMFQNPQTVTNTTSGPVYTDIKYNVYVVGSDWDSGTVTYNSAPIGTIFKQNTELSYISEVDLADAIKTAVQSGATTLSVRISSATQRSGGEQKMWFDASTGVKPYLILSYEGASASVTQNVHGVEYVYGILPDAEDNGAIWTNAQNAYNAWLSTYGELVNNGSTYTQLYTETNTLTSSATGTYAGQSNLLGSQPKTYTAHTTQSFTDLQTTLGTSFANAQRDAYGGIINSGIAIVESTVQGAAGYFRIGKDTSGKWWLITPAGNPFIAAGMSDVHYSQGGSPAQKAAVESAYGNYNNWADETIELLKDLGFTNISRPVSQAYKPNAVGENVAATYLLQKADISISGCMADYGKFRNLLADGNGSTVFKNNNTMPVFDPEFVTWADSWCKGYENLENVKNVIGFMSDNELPMDYDMLERTLGLDPTRKENYYSYAAAWYWFAQMTADLTVEEGASVIDIIDTYKEETGEDLRDLFRGFVYDRYFRIVETAFNTYDQNHMYMGVRFVTQANDSEWVMRVSSLYLDCMTINWYDALWEPDYDGLHKLEAWFGKPFIVTEFYAKGGGSYDQDGNALPNDTGAGIYTQTQEERGLFYESYVIRLLESRNAVGWEWFQYMDNATDTGTNDLSSEGANKGIVASYVDEETGKLKEYTELTAHMQAVNEKMYEIAYYFTVKNTGAATGTLTATE